MILNFPNWLTAYSSAVALFNVGSFQYLVRRAAAVTWQQQQQQQRRWWIFFVEINRILKLFENSIFVRVIGVTLSTHRSTDAWFFCVYNLFLAANRSEIKGHLLIIIVTVKGLGNNSSVLCCVGCHLLPITF